MSARRLTAIVASLALFICAAYSLYWFHAAGQVQNRAQAWAETRRSEGWSVDWQALETSGFPWHLTLSVTQPRLVTPSGLSWAAGHLRVSTLPLWPDKAHLSTSGHQDIWWNGRDLGGELESLDADLSPGTADAHAHGMRHTSGLTFADMALSLARLPPHPTPTGHPASWRFALSARDVGLPAAAGIAGFAEQLALAEISGRVMGAIPDGPPMAAIARWSKQGGVLELDHLAADWPPMGLEGDGTAALDPHGQPLVALSTRIRGFDSLMDRLGQSGLIDPASARTLKTILGLMSKPDPRGRPAITAPLSIQDGQLYLGPARLTPVPAIPWADFTSQ